MTRLATRSVAVLPPTDDALRASDKLEKGLPFSALAHFQKQSGLGLEMLADAVQIPVRTLRRRRQHGRLTPDESDRLYRFTRLFDMAAALFDGDTAGAKAWMVSPARALGGRTPISLARTFPGARAVEDLIGQLEHGVFP